MSHYSGNPCEVIDYTGYTKVEKRVKFKQINHCHFGLEAHLKVAFHYIYSLQSSFIFHNGHTLVPAVMACLSDLTAVVPENHIAGQSLHEVEHKIQ